jgi:hypothetical protein
LKVEISEEESEKRKAIGNFNKSIGEEDEEQKDTGNLSDNNNFEFGNWSDYTNQRPRTTYFREDYWDNNNTMEDTHKAWIEALERMGGRNPIPVTAFKGTVEEDPNEWLRNYNNTAKAYGWNDKIKLEAVISYLKGSALDWFEEVQEEIKNWKEAEDVDGNGFEEEFLKKFTTQERKNLWYSQFNNLEQKEDESVSTYTSKFKKLLRKVDPEKKIPAELISQRYLSGLKGDLAERVIEHDPEDIEAMITRAKKVEKGKNYNKNKASSNPYVRKEEVKERKSFNNEGPFSRGWKGYNEKSNEREVDPIEELTKKFDKMEIKLMEQMYRNKEVTCYICNKTGHTAKECKNMVCYKCGQKGHTVKFCEKEGCRLCGNPKHTTEKCYRNYECKKCGRKGHTEKICTQESRRVNYVNYSDDEYEDEDEEEVYYVNSRPRKYVYEDSTDEEEVYITTRSGKKYDTEKKSESKKEKKLRKPKVKENDAMDIDDERVIKVKRTQDKSKIEKGVSYNIVEDLENARVNATFAQLLQDPKQRKLLKDALKRTTFQELADD